MRLVVAKHRLVLLIGTVGEHGRDDVETTSPLNLLFLLLQVLLAASSRATQRIQCPLERRGICLKVAKAVLGSELGRLCLLMLLLRRANLLRLLVEVVDVIGLYLATTSHIR